MTQKNIRRIEGRSKKRKCRLRIADYGFRIQCTGHYALVELIKPFSLPVTACPAESGNHFVTKTKLCHGGTVTAGKQVIAQFGEDSDELQKLGKKKKSEYKKRTGRKPAPATA